MIYGQEIKPMKKLATQHADVYSVFSNDKRVLIFWLLAGHEMSVQDIANAVGTSVQNTSQHLRLMKTKRILDFRREGNTILYKVSDSDIGKHCLYIHHLNLEDSGNGG